MFLIWTYFERMFTPHHVSCVTCHMSCNELCCFQRLAVLYTKELFQTADGKMAESRMGDEEACLDLKLEKMI